MRYLHHDELVLALSVIIHPRVLILRGTWFNF